MISSEVLNFAKSVCGDKTEYILPLILGEIIDHDTEEQDIGIQNLAICISSCFGASHGDRYTAISGLSRLTNTINSGGIPEVKVAFINPENAFPAFELEDNRILILTDNNPLMSMVVNIASSMHRLYIEDESKVPHR